MNEFTKLCFENMYNDKHPSFLLCGAHQNVMTLLSEEVVAVGLCVWWEFQDHFEIYNTRIIVGNISCQVSIENLFVESTCNLYSFLPAVSQSDNVIPIHTRSLHRLSFQRFRTWLCIRVSMLIDCKSEATASSYKMINQYISLEPFRCNIYQQLT